MSESVAIKLLTPHGGRTHLQFWQGFDVVSGQEVALTLIEPDCECLTSSCTRSWRVPSV